MSRTKNLVIRLGRDERKALDRLAKKERLPTSTLARKVLLDLAEKRAASQGSSGP
jgi:hypothetical protein